MSWENRGSINAGTAQATVYSTDGGTNFRWARIDGEVTQVYDTDYADPAVAIMAAWAWLDGQGGGVLRTRGPGETWVTEVEITSQGPYITWISDWSLLLQGIAGLDDNLIYIYQDDYVSLIGLNLDHQCLDQSTGDAIRVYDSHYLFFSRIKILDARVYGLRLQYCDWCTAEYIYVDGAGVENGFAWGAGCNFCYGYRIVATRCGGVGINCYQATFCTLKECVAYTNRDQLGIGSGGGTVSGFTCEESYDIKYVRCRAWDNNQHGFMSNSPLVRAERVELINCDFFDNDEHGISIWNNAFKHHIKGGLIYNNVDDDILVNDGTDCLIENVQIESAAGITCIEANTAPHLRVTNCKFITTGTGLDINNANVTDCIVDQNDFNDCTTDVAAGAAVNPHWGSNLDQAGNWDTGVQP